MKYLALVSRDKKISTVEKIDGAATSEFSVAKSRRKRCQHTTPKGGQAWSGMQHEPSGQRYAFYNGMSSDIIE